MPTDPNKHEQIKAYLGKVVKNKVAPTKEKNVTLDEVELFAKILPEDFKLVTPSPPPQPEFTFEYETIIDSNHPEVGFVTVDDANRLTVHMPDGWLIQQPRALLVRDHLESGDKRFPISEAFVFSVNSIEQRTCKYFSPGKDYIDSFGAVVSTEYDLDRPHTQNQCSYKPMQKLQASPTPLCGYDQSMAGCEYYEAESWQRVREVKYSSHDNATETLVLEHVRLGYGFPVFRILRYIEDNEIPTVLDRFSSMDHKEKVEEVAITFFDAHVDNNAADNIVEVELSNITDTPTPNRYFDYVLA